jgi:hypothetical protein
MAAHAGEKAQKSGDFYCVNVDLSAFDDEQRRCAHAGAWLGRRGPGGRRER